jgi:DnaJ like chaperone protein
MLWPVTVLGAAAGLALASIPGALLGGVLGHSVDRRLRLHSWAVLGNRLGWPAQPSDNDLQFILLGRLAKCDGRVQEAHIAQARAEMRRLNLNADGQQQAIQAFSRGKSADESLRLPMRRLRNRPELVRRLLSSCWRLAAAEGQVSDRKRDLILLWGRWAGCTPTGVMSLYQRTQYEARTSSTVSTRTRNPYEEALHLLGVGETSEPKDIKRAYRRLLSQYHPDKQAGAGASEIEVRQATEKTRELHSAYALIRERHGF